MLEGLVWTISTAVLFAALDALRKQLSSKYAVSQLALILCLGQIPLFWLWGTVDNSFYFSSFEYFAVYALSVAVNIVALASFVRSVSLSPLSETVPLLCLSPVFSSLLGLAIGEQTGALGWLGILLILIGSWLIPKSPLLMQKDKPLLHAYRGHLFMLLAALCWGSSILIDKICLEFAGHGFHAFAISLGMAVCFVLFKLRTNVKWTAINLANLPVLIILIVVATGALGSQLVAIQSVGVGLVEATKRATSVFAALMLGVIIFRESASTKKIIASVLFILGVCFTLFSQISLSQAS